PRPPGARRRRGQRRLRAGLRLGPGPHPPPRRRTRRGPPRGDRQAGAPAAAGRAMSDLVLVRHAQASFLADDYDRLSPLGESQAEPLGAEWARRSVRFDEVYTGPRRRQQQTAERVGAAYRASGLGWPEPVVVDELDEYDLTGLLERLAPALCRSDDA